MNINKTLIPFAGLLLASVVFFGVTGTAQAVTGMERRAVELGANAVCSEPLNTNIYTRVLTSWLNPADSTTKECTGQDGIAAIARTPDDFFGTNDSAILGLLPAGHTNTWVFRGADGHIGFVQTGQIFVQA